MRTSDIREEWGQFQNVRVYVCEMGRLFLDSFGILNARKVDINRGNCTSDHISMCQSLSESTTICFIKSVHAKPFFCELITLQHSVEGDM